MTQQNRDADQEHLEQHSLPGTNQAGKGPESCAQDESEPGPPGFDDARTPRQDQREAHSLPGTNQGGKDPGGP